MKKIYWEILIALLFVIISTSFISGWLSGIQSFWNAQIIWSIILAIGWGIISVGYFHQGIKVRKAHSATQVSFFLPASVFVVQCVLFVKGIYYHDWSLIFGAIIVNAGVVFSLYHIGRATWFRTKNSPQ